MYRDVEGNILAVIDGHIPSHYKSGVVECICRRVKRARRILESIPPEFQHKTLWNTKPRDDRHVGQRDVLPALQARPLDSYLVCGISGSGKNHLSWCLGRMALAAGKTVISLNVHQYLDDLVSLQKEGAEVDPIMPLSIKEWPLKPIVQQNLIGTLRERGRSLLLMLHEFDKPNPTQFASKRVFEIIDAVYENHHQLIITSNEDRNFLKRHWSSFSESFGAPIMRRLDERCNLVEMF
jgi:DNA replication protein DnaC